MIRKIREDDAPRLFEIFQQAQISSSVPIGPRWNEAQFAEECRAGGVAFVDAHDEVTAFILYRDLGDAFEIEMLATAPDFLRRGQMQSLLRVLFSETQNVESQPIAVWLEVHEANASAILLYEKMGFKRVGKRARYYSDGGAALLYNYG